MSRKVEMEMTMEGIKILKTQQGRDIYRERGLETITVSVNLKHSMGRHRPASWSKTWPVRSFTPWPSHKPKGDYRNE